MEPGFLSTQIIELPEAGIWEFTDLSSGMLDVCRKKLKRVTKSGATSQRVKERYELRPLDIYGLEAVETYDVIVSSFTLQWLQDLENWLPRVVRALKPGGLALFNTLGPNSFLHWREKWAESEGPVPMPPKFCSANDFERQLKASEVASGIKTEFSVECRQLKQRFSGLHNFFRHLKRIGANSSLQPCTQISFSDLRNWRQARSSKTVEINYEVLELRITRSIK